MEIKKIKGRTLEIYSRDASIVAFAQDLSENEIKEAEANIVLGAKVDSAFSINSPGEYETKEVWVMAQQSDVKTDIVDFFVLNIEEVKVGIIDSKIKSLTKKQIEKIGVIDILIVDVSEEMESKFDIISEIDPQIVVPVGFTDESFVKFTKELGINDVQEEKKIKAKMEDFSLEEYQIKVFKLL